MLKGKQKKLDANKDGEISGDDFKMLQSKKEMKKGGKVLKLGGIDGLLKVKSIYDKMTGEKPEKKSKGGSIFSRQNYKQTGKI
jgi:hypothetical protein